MVPRWLPDPKKEPFGVTLECLLDLFWDVFWMIVFNQNVMSLFKLVVTSGCFFWSSIASIIHWHSFFMCFSYPYSVGVVEAAPPGAAEDHCSCWDMQTRDHHSCCICVCSSFECKSCETFCLQCSSLERASRSLAKTGFFLGLLGVFLFVCFLFGF